MMRYGILGLGLLIAQTMAFISPVHSQGQQRCLTFNPNGRTVIPRITVPAGNVSDLSICAQFLVPELGVGVFVHKPRTVTSISLLPLFAKHQTAAGREGEATVRRINRSGFDVDLIIPTVTPDAFSGLSYYMEFGASASGQLEMSVFFYQVNIGATLMQAAFSQVLLGLPGAELIENNMSNDEKVRFIELKMNVISRALADSAASDRVFNVEMSRALVEFANRDRALSVMLLQWSLRTFAGMKALIDDAIQQR